MTDKLPAHPEINMSKLAVGGTIGGAIFTLGSMSIFLTGIPFIRSMFPAAVAVGCALALVRHFTLHEKSSTSQVLDLKR